MMSDISELNTQQDVREKRMAKRSCVTKLTGLLLVYFVANFTINNVFWLFYICLKKGEVWQNFFKTQVQSHKVCHLLFSAVLLCKFTIIYWISTATSESNGAHKA